MYSTYMHTYVCICNISTCVILFYMSQTTTCMYVRYKMVIFFVKKMTISYEMQQITIEILLTVIECMYRCMYVCMYANVMLLNIL